MAHGLPTSYNDFFRFMQLVKKIGKIIVEKRNEPTLNYDEVTKKIYDTTLYMLIRNDEFVNELTVIPGGMSEFVKKLKSYLISTSGKRPNKLEDYNIWKKYLICMGLFDNDINGYLYEQLYRVKSLGIEGGLVELINTNKLDHMDIGEIEKQLVFLNLAFNTYLKDVILVILYEVNYTQYSKFISMNKIKALEESKENIGAILNFNYTSLLRLYEQQLSAYTNHPNGKVKTTSGIFGICIEEINKDKQKRYSQLSKEKMRLIYKKLYEIKYASEEDEEMKELILSEKNEFTEFIDESGKFDTKRYINSLDNIDTINIYGHSMALADKNILKPILIHNTIKKINIYVFIKKREEELDKYSEEGELYLFKKKECNNLIKMIYDKECFNDLDEEEKEKFCSKYHLKATIDQEYCDLSNYVDTLDKQQQILKQSDPSYKTTSERVEEKIQQIINR